MPQERRLAGTGDLDGLLGSDALAYVDLWIDLRGRHVKARFAQAGTLGWHTNGRRINLSKSDSRPVVVAQLEGIGLPADDARLVLASGANGLVLFGELARNTASAARHTLVMGRMESPTATRSSRLFPSEESACRVRSTA